MAINPNSQYPPPATDAPGTNYPYGSAANESTPGALDGFPFEKASINDVLGFIQAILRSNGTAPSGTSETAVASQVLRGLQSLSTAGNFFNETGAADAYVLETLTNRQAPLAYLEGMVVRCEIGNTNTTTAPTINVAGLGIKNISGVAVGQLVAGTVYSFRYDGTDFVTSGVTALELSDKVSKSETAAQSIASDLEFGKDILRSDWKVITDPYSANSTAFTKNLRNNGGNLELIADGYGTILRQDASGRFTFLRTSQGLAGAVPNFYASLKISEKGLFTGDTLSTDMTSGAANATALDADGVLNHSRSGNVSAVHDRIYNGVFGGVIGYEEVNGSEVRKVLGHTYGIVAGNSSTNVAYVQSTNGAYTANVLNVRCATSASSGFNLAQFYSANGTDLKFNFRGDGEATCDGSWTGGGADYAEYFEWEDGNPNNEDRVGCSVSLVGDKIKIAEDGDDILGVISGNPSVVGNGAGLAWDKKYLKDDFGRYLREDYAVVSWTEKVEGKEEPVQHSYETDKVPADITVPENAVTTEMTGKQGRQILSPDYDESIEYASREDRQEWDTVGLLGKLRVKAGQKTDPSWTLLRDISDTVKEYLIK